MSLLKYLPKVVRFQKFYFLNKEPQKSCLFPAKSFLSKSAPWCDTLPSACCVPSIPTTSHTFPPGIAALQVVGARCAGTIPPLSFSTPTQPHSPCASGISPIVSDNKKAIRRTRNIFFSPGPLANWGHIEISLFHLFNIHENKEIAADSGGLRGSRRAQTDHQSPAAFCLKKVLSQAAGQDTPFNNLSPGLHLCQHLRLSV